MADAGKSSLACVKNCEKFGMRGENRRAGTVNRLCLWCERMEIPEGSPLADYVGRAFYAPAPDWKLK